MTIDIRSQRRQQFLTQDLYDSLLPYYQGHQVKLNELLAGPISDVGTRRRWSYFLSDGNYELLSLRYTAGEDLHALRAELPTVIEAYERLQRAIAAAEGVPTITPLGFAMLDDYERSMQLISLCYLLHRRDLLPRLAALLDPGYAAEDTLYEDLLSYELEGRHDVDWLYWQTPYQLLVSAMYREDDKDSQRDLQAYLKAWYPAFKHVAWHNGHLNIRGTEGYYFGYWAFEAGAVAYLIDLDDSQIDHLVYPKDLVKFAREFDPSKDPLLTLPATERLRCEAGQPCLRSGWWWSPGHPQGPQHFEQGQILPKLGGDFGDTIWYWEPDRQG